MQIESSQDNESKRQGDDSVENNDTLMKSIPEEEEVGFDELPDKDPKPDTIEPSSQGNELF